MRRRGVGLGMRVMHSDADTWILDRWPNDDVAAVATGDCTANQNYFVGFADLHDLQILDGHALIPGVAGHSHVLPDSPGRRSIPDGAIAAMRFGSVGCALAGEVMFLHHARSEERRVGKECR